MLNRSALLAALAVAVVTVPVEGLGDVSFRQLTSDEVTAAREAASADGKVDNVAFCHRLVVASLVGDDGKPILTDADLPALAGGRYGAVDRLVAATLKANGMAPAAAEAAAKN